MLTTIPSIPNFTPTVSGTDQEETPDADLPYVDLIGLFIGIEYRNAAGQVTRRRITIHGVTAEHLKAYCYEREAPRSFRIDRVVSFVDLDGVIFDLPEFFEKLGGTPGAVNVRYRFEPKAGDCLRKPWRREIAVLAALSASDGFIHPAEVEAIIQFVGMSAEDEGVEYDGADLSALAETVRQLKVSEHDAIEHLEVIARDVRDHRRGTRLMRAISAVATSDGILHPTEFRFAQMAQRRLMPQRILTSRGRS